MLLHTRNNEHSVTRVCVCVCVCVCMRRLPAIITGAMSHWPAMGAGDGSRAWNNLRYLKSVAGLRTVRIVTMYEALEPRSQPDVGRYPLRLETATWTTNGPSVS